MYNKCLEPVSFVFPWVLMFPSTSLRKLKLIERPFVYCRAKDFRNKPFELQLMQRLLMLTLMLISQVWSRLEHFKICVNFKIACNRRDTNVLSNRNLPNTGRMFHPALSYETSRRTQPFNGVHMWHVSCILPGSVVAIVLNYNKWIKIVSFKLVLA